MRGWLLGALALCAAAVTPALALDPPAPDEPGAPAPMTHVPTGLILPLSIAGVPFMRSIDYARSDNDPGLGYGYTYGIPGRLLVTVYVYDLGRRVPGGHDSTVIAAAFAESLENIHVAARRSGKYHDLRVVQAPTLCGYGTVVFRCSTFSAISADGSQPLYGKLLLTAYRGSFVKLRVDWRQDAPDDTAEVERIVQTFVGAVLR